MKKIKLRHPGELHKLPETDEWVEVEFTEPFTVKSVYKTSKSKKSPIKKKITA